MKQWQLQEYSDVLCELSKHSNDLEKDTFAFFDEEIKEGYLTDAIVQRNQRDPKLVEIAISSGRRYVYLSVEEQ
jgi:hypothetical protein